MKSVGGVIAAIVLIAVGLACDGASRIGGRVVNTEGRPIGGASVLFEAVEKGEPAKSYQCEAKTSPDGTFGCGFVHAPWDIEVRLSVSKEGYETYVRHLSSSELKKSPGGNMGSQIITLEPH